MKLSTKQKNISFVLVICAFVALFVCINWYMDPYRGLGDVSEIEITSFPNEIALDDFDGGAGGIVFYLQISDTSDSASYTYEAQSHFDVEKYVNGKWYSVNSQNQSGQFDLPPVELDTGRNEIIVEWNSTLRSGIYRMIVTIVELQDGEYSSTYSEAILFAV